MTIDSLVNNMHATNLRIATAMDDLDPEEQRMLESYPEYNTDKTKAASAFLNNFYFRLPGGWLMELVTENSRLKTIIGEDVLLPNQKQKTYSQLFDDVRESLLDSELSRDEYFRIASLTPKGQKEYLFSQGNFYRLMPIMLEAYIALRKKGYKREELIS